MRVVTVLRRVALVAAFAALLAPTVAAAQPAAQPRGAPMIHMFVLRLTAGLTAAQKTEVVSRIQALQGQIPGLVETSVGVNQSPRGQGFDIGGSMRFASPAALAAYNDHPEHQKLLQWLGPMVVQAIEADFPAN